MAKKTPALRRGDGAHLIRRSALAPLEFSARKARENGLRHSNSDSRRPRFVSPGATNGAADVRHAQVYRSNLIGARVAEAIRGDPTSPRLALAQLTLDS